MATYLTQEWLELQRAIAQDFPETPGATVRLQYHVKDGPGGDVDYFWVLEDGKLLEACLGDDPDAEVELTVTWDDSGKIQRAELDETAAFMQGRLKATGNMGKLMALMPLTQSAEYKDLKARITEQTGF